MDPLPRTLSSRDRSFSAQKIHGSHDIADGATKVCLYSHDTFGLGHLRRNLAIADQLLRSDGRFAVWLLTGSPVIRQWTLPPGLRVQPLPPVVKTGAERYASRQAGQPFGLTKGYREALILKLVEEERPDVLLVDHAPAGMNGELLSTLALIRNEMPRTRTVLGLRDILDEPSTVRRVWEEQEIPSLIEHAYDDVFVYGSERLFDVVAGYGMAASLAQRVKYCGYVVGRSRFDQLHGRASGAVCWNPARAAGRPVVLVTAGGGGDGQFLMRAYVRALRAHRSSGFYTVIVTGPLMPADQSAELHAAVAGRDDVDIVAYTTDLVPSIRHAALVVSMAGYNTSVELLAARKKAILVPRSAPREEQRLRAKLLADLGLCTYAEPGPDLVAALEHLVPAALAAAPPPDRLWDAVDLQGADRVVAELDAVTADARGLRVRGVA